MIDNNYFAAFIMTYKRVSVLEDTIKILLNQSCPPQKILIVDNDPDSSAKDIVSKFPLSTISYHPVGYNSGPAGAATIGLTILAKEGYQWIGWMDDDDPPVFENTFEILLKTAASNKNCGCVGTVGQYFNRKTGMMVRVPNEKLTNAETIEVDNIAGGMCKIVNADVCLKSNVYPDSSLFYGFEELDFDLRLQKAGYILLVDTALYKKHRIHFNRVDVVSSKGNKKDKNRLWREYYSTRNGLIILNKNKFIQAFSITLLRHIFKVFFGFRYGINYGFLNAKIVVTALYHYCIGKRGAVNLSN